MEKITKENKTNVAGEPKKTVPTLNADQVSKDYLKIKLYETKLRDKLLGEFSPSGEYKITDEKMISSLINIPKRYADKQESFVYASTIVDNVVLNFRIEMNISESYCNASLSIIEVEHGIETDKKHVTRLDSFVDVYSPKFKEQVYKRWKVYFEEDVYEKDDYLKNYLKKLNEELLFNKELTAILSQLYIVRMLKLLDSCGEIGEKVKLEYKLIVEKILNKDASITQDFTRLKLILDYVIQKNNALPTLLKSQEALAIMQNYSAPIQRIKDKTVAPRVTEVQGLPEKKEEKKQDNKKKSSPAKKKSKSKGKKKNDKPFVYDFKNFKTELKGSVKGLTFGEGLGTKKPTEKQKETTTVKEDSSQKERVISKPAVLPMNIGDKINQTKSFFDSSEDVITNRPIEKEYVSTAKHNFTENEIIQEQKKNLEVTK